MNENYEARGRWVEKIAFFGLFIAVLLIAYLLVIWKSAIVLSEPMELNCAGLSVSIPTGAGWQSENRWKYQSNSFALDSFFTPGSGSITAIVSCRYHLAAPETTPEALFREKAFAIDGSKIAKTGQRPGSSSAKGQKNESIPTIDWAHIEGPKALFDTFFAVVQLPNNRRLDIEVYQGMDDTELAEEIFNSIIGSLKFTKNRLLEAGSKIVTEIKGKGLDSFLASVGNKSDEAGQEQGKESFFLIKDARGRTIGFTMEALDRPEAGQFEAKSFYYIRGRQEQVAFFRSDNNLNEFIWKSETSGPGGRSGIEIILDKNGIMTVKEFDLQTKEEDYQISSAAIPDVLGEFAFRQMLDSDWEEIFVDIIGADGKITPALVSRIDTRSSAALQSQNSETDAARQETAYVFEVELLDGHGFSEQVYLDNQRQISRRLLQQESTYTLERTGAENILREFPERGRYILQSPIKDALQQKDKILEQDQLQEISEQQLPTTSY